MDLGMGELQCPICFQPVRICGRSERRSTSFETIMMQGFRRGGNVPCKWSVNVDSFATGNFMVATDKWNHTFDLYLEKRWGRTIVCGPYWRSLVRMFGIQLGDVVCFELADNHMEDEMDQGIVEKVIKCDVCVYSMVDNIKQEKHVVSDAVLFPVIPEVRAALRNIVFSEILDVEEHEMAAINFALYKVASMAPLRELEEGEFYVKTSEMKYFVRRVNVNNVILGGLSIPEKILDAYKYNLEGNSLFWRRGLEHPIQGMYNCLNKRILFVQGINELLVGVNIPDGTIVLVRVDPRPEAIRLDLVEVIYPL